MSTKNTTTLIISKLKDHYSMKNNTDFAKMLGIAPTTLSSWLTRDSLDYNLIYSKCVDIDANWLLTGEGDMLRSSSKSIAHPSSYRPITGGEHLLDSQEVPFYDIEASAGFKMLFSDKTQNIIDTIRIPHLGRCDGAIAITGDSMYPLMKSGDIVLFKEVHSLDYLHYGDIHIVSYTIDGDDYTVIKYIQKSERVDHVKLASYNSHYDPIEVPLSAINAIALVKANIRYNTM